MSSSQQEIQFIDDWYRRVIIVMKGLPWTGKSQIAKLIGEWARCEVCYIDDFMDAFSLERGYSPSSPPSGDEADRLHRLALETLYRVARRHLTHSSRGVIIKSRLCSTFELDLLIRIFYNHPWPFSPIMIIVECRMQNEYRWRSQVESVWDRLEEAEDWYKVGSWKDIEKAKEDCDSQALDLHLLSSLEVNYRSQTPRVTRLVLDSADDLNYDPSVLLQELTPDFKHALMHLLWKHIEEDRWGYEASYVAVLQLGDVRRYLLEQELDASRERSQYLCTKENTKAGCCILKYWEELGSDEVKGSCCGVCAEEVVLGQPAYTCHFCILTLHKSCAETPLDFTCLKRVHDEHVINIFIRGEELKRLYLEKRFACKSCNEKGQHFSDECQACYLETHLKCGVLPTVINHDSHQLHFLSLQVESNRGKSTCKACRRRHWYTQSGYACHICNFFSHRECVFLPGEVKQEHGGYEHVMKLMYSHDGMEQEDDHWCNGCYADIDPQVWFYSCQECPYYVTHADHYCVGRDQIQEAVRNGNVPIQQMRDRFNTR